jgi:hypothetical protein
MVVVMPARVRVEDPHQGLRMGAVGHINRGESKTAKGKEHRHCPDQKHVDATVEHEGPKGADETIKTANELSVNYRTAAFVNALRKIETVYSEAGITI